MSDPVTAAGAAAAVEASRSPLAVHLRGVHKRFGSVHAVRGIDLDSSAGEILAFLGPNGAGKTSTID